MENSPINQPSPSPIRGGQRATQRGTTPRPSEKPGADRSPAFQVLLDRLQKHARELERARETVDDPARLAGAVDSARASLEDALSLGQELLEAYRAQSQTSAQDDRGEQDQGGRS